MTGILTGDLGIGSDQFVRKNLCEWTGVQRRGEGSEWWVRGRRLIDLVQLSKVIRIGQVGAGQTIVETVEHDGVAALQRDPHVRVAGKWHRDQGFLIDGVGIGPKLVLRLG